MLDVMMPGMGGEAVLAALRMQSETAEIPVISITARKHAEELPGLRLWVSRACWANHLTR